MTPIWVTPPTTGRTTDASTRPAGSVAASPRAGRSSPRDGDDAGQTATFAVIAITTLAVVLIVALAQVGSIVLDRSAAQSAADAAALAGVVRGRAAADVVARANGATIVSWSTSGYEVSVTVRLGDEYATARATDAP